MDSDRHAAVLEELAEWWQDLSQHVIPSRALLLPVPSQWGRTHLLNKFTLLVQEDEQLSITVPIQGKKMPDGLGLQAQEMQKLFSEVRIDHLVAELLGVDRLGGVIQLGLGIAGLFVSPLAALVSLLLASVGVGTVSKAWDKSLAGQEGIIAKLGRAVAAVSKSVPIIVIIDDADLLVPDLAVVLIESLIERFDGQVLVVAAVDPSSDLMSTLNARSRYGLIEGRVRTIDVDPGMDYQARASLATELSPLLPVAAIRRISQRTQTFAEVFAVAPAERLAELDTNGDETTAVEVVDEVIDALLDRTCTSGLATVLSWVGGIMHARQAEQAVAVLGEGRADGKDGVIRFESLVRLTDVASPDSVRRANVRIFAKRQSLAATVLDIAIDIGNDPSAGLVEKVVAWQAAHRVRTDVPNRTLLMVAQCLLVRSLEDLNDPASAYEVARIALKEYLAGRPSGPTTRECEKLEAAVMRLAQSSARKDSDPLVDATVAAVAAGGAAIDLEARVWAAIELLNKQGRRQQALDLVDQIADELSRRNDLGTIGDRWRLLLAFNIGRAGAPAITQRLLAPILIATSRPVYRDAAQAVLRTVGGPRADTRLQIIGLEAELQAITPEAENDRLRVHHALAVDYGQLGDYQHALYHSERELLLRHRIQGPDHPDTLDARGSNAFYTGWCGRAADALELYEELLPDQERLLGPDHHSTLATRNAIAYHTGSCVNAAEALRLFQELLPDMMRVLGRDHPDTLTLRSEIASYTGLSGNGPQALRLHQQLLPDEQRVIGSGHPDTIRTQINIAFHTAQCGYTAEALQLYKELLPAIERVLGADHPDTLTVRLNIATYTTVSGDIAEALQLYQDLLPDMERVLGPNRPQTLAVRDVIRQLRS